jgi:protease I
MRRFSFLASVTLLAVVVWGCTKQQPMSEAPVPQPEVSGGSAAGTAAEQPLAGQKLLFVVAPKDFRDEEYTIPHETLTEAGAEAEVASVETGTATGVKGTAVEVTLAARDVQPDDFSAVIFIGGPGLQAYLDDPDLTALAKRFAEADKLVAAICFGPAVLAHAGLLEGRRATVFKTEEDTLKDAGATLTSEDAVVDGKIITAPGPEAAQAFADAIEATLSAQGETG